MNRRSHRYRAFAGIASVALAALIVLAPGVVDVSAAPAHHTAATVHVAKLSVGDVLVDAAGRTVYVFSSDKHHHPTCANACAGYWPPLLVSHVHAGMGVKKKWLGSVKRADGKRQATYHHWPLYTFVGDKKSGEATGQGMHGFGGSWSTITAKGRTDFGKATARPGPPTSPTSSSNPSPQSAGSQGTSGVPTGTPAASPPTTQPSSPPSSPPTTPPATTPPTTTPPTTTPPTTTPPTTTTPPYTSGSGGWGGSGGGW
jgi:predicted lipoprotein with Yx(FWY)xxD motif